MGGRQELQDRPGLKLPWLPKLPQLATDDAGLLRRLRYGELTDRSRFTALWRAVPVLAVAALLGLSGVCPAALPASRSRITGCDSSVRPEATRTDAQRRLSSRMSRA